MGQRKLGQHTQAVVYKNLSQQRTKKATNVCLVISPFIICGLLFGLQLAINYLFLDRPEFRVSTNPKKKFRKNKKLFCFLDQAVVNFVFLSSTFRVFVLLGTDFSSVLLFSSMMLSAAVNAWTAAFSKTMGPIQLATLTGQIFVLLLTSVREGTTVLAALSTRPLSSSGSAK